LFRDSGPTVEAANFCVIEVLITAVSTFTIAPPMLLSDIPDNIAQSISGGETFTIIGPPGVIKQTGDGDNKPPGLDFNLNGDNGGGTVNPAFGPSAQIDGFVSGKGFPKGFVSLTVSV
jgi:hypothetical protein